MKNAIAKSKAAIHSRRNPIKIMVNAAPIRNIKPVVENNPLLVFAESCLSERRVKYAEIIPNIQRITRTTIIAAMNGAASEKVILDVSGVMPENDEMLDQEPFQVGYIFSKKSLILGKINANPIATAATTPTIPIRIP